MDCVGVSTKLRCTKYEGRFSGQFYSTHGHLQSLYKSRFKIGVPLYFFLEQLPDGTGRRAQKFVLLVVYMSHFCGPSTNPKRLVESMAVYISIRDVLSQWC